MESAQAKDASVQATGVTVRVTDVTGKDVLCEMTGRDVSDDGIFLAVDQMYDIQLTLDPATYGLVFHREKPFTHAKHKCPPEFPGGNAQHPFTATRESDTLLTIHAAKVSKRGVAHFRLNFEGGTSYDPIIIHQ